MTQLWNDYGKWLLKEVGFVDERFDAREPGYFGRAVKPSNYDILMRSLHNRDFIWIIERDENRMKDGLSLRYNFFDECDVNGGNFGSPCSVLEMLVALVIRLDSEFIGDPGNPHPEYLFWEMLCNLGLNLYDDSHWDEQKFNKIIDIWLERRFSKSGDGGIFPLESATFDCRNEEIWRLALAYLNENF